MSNKLLLDKHPLVIIPDLAVAIGLNESIVLQQVHYWVEINTKAKRNFHDDYYWTYNTLEEWREQFPFWSVRTVRRTLTNLLNSGLLISGNFNVLRIDRTKWYRVNHKCLDEVISLMDRPCGQIGHMHQVKMATPLPETNNREEHTIISSSPSSKKIAASSKSALPKHKVKILEPVH